MLDPNFQDPSQQRRLSDQKLEAIRLLMDQTVSNPDMENINKLKDIMGVPSEPSEYNTTEWLKINYYFLSVLSIIEYGKTGDENHKNTMYQLVTISRSLCDRSQTVTSPLYEGGFSCMIAVWRTLT